jgi:hypothetical protein
LEQDKTTDEKHSVIVGMEQTTADLPSVLSINWQSAADFASVLWCCAEIADENPSAVIAGP